MNGFGNFHALYKYVLHTQPLPNVDCTLGYIYYDDMAGVSLNLEGGCMLSDGKLKITSNFLKEEKRRSIFRLNSTPGNNFYILFTNQIKELGLPERPDWLDSYSKPHEEYIRKIEFLHPFRFPNCPNDVLVILPQDPEHNKYREDVWVKLIKLEKDKTLKGILLNKPHQDLGISKDDKITVIPLFDEVEKSFYLVCQEAMNHSFSSSDWMKNKSNAFKVYNKAISKFNDLLIDTKNNAKLWFERANFLSDFHQFDAAYFSFNRGLQIDPSNEEAWFGKWFSLFTMGHFNEALDTIDVVLRFNPNNVYALSNKGAVLNKMERFGEAIEYYDRALRIEPNNPKLLIDKGLVFMNLKQYKNAIDIFNKLIEFNPKSSFLWCKKGNSNLLLNRVDEAIFCFDKAISLNPGNNEAHEHLKVALQKKKSQ